VLEIISYEALNLYELPIYIVIFGGGYIFLFIGNYFFAFQMFSKMSLSVVEAFAIVLNWSR